MVSEDMPRRLDKYEIIEQIGTGGFADVYKALDPTLDRQVALKVLAPHLLRDPEFVRRFQREARTAAKLRHPNIVVIHEIGEDQGRYYIAMEYLEGATLKEVIEKQGPLPPQRVIGILNQLASALDYAHEKGVVHRDIKPSNIILGPEDHATITDFSIVKAAESTGLTTTGQILGTPEYMSPEQGQGQEVTPRSDIYSLGVVLYEMLAGKVPFEAPTPLALMMKHASDPPPPIPEINAELPAAMQAAVEKALAKDPEDRYQTASELAHALRQRGVTPARMVDAVVPPSAPRVPASPWVGAVPPGARTRLGKGSINEAVLSPDGDHLAVASTIGVYVYGAHDMKEAWFARTGAQANTVAFAPGGAKLACGLIDGVIALRDVQTGRQTQRIESEGRQSVDVVAFSPDGTMLAVGQRGGTVIMWDIESGLQLRVLEERAFGVRSVVFSPDGSLLASVPSGWKLTLSDDPVFLWDVRTGRKVRTFGGGWCGASKVAFSPNGAILASASEDKYTVTLWDVSTGERLRSLWEWHKSSIRSVAFSADGDVLASASDDLTVMLWQVQGGSTPLTTLKGHMAPVHSIFFFPDGVTLASASDAEVKVWKVQSGEEVRALEETHGPAVNSVAFSPQGTSLASASGRSVSLWNVHTGEQTQTWGLRGTEEWEHHWTRHGDMMRAGVAISPDGLLVASPWRRNRVALWEVLSGRQVRVLKGHRDPVCCLAFSPDGATLVTGSRDATVSLFEAATGRWLRKLEAHADSVRSVAISPGGAILASGSSDKTVSLWDMQAHARVRTLEGHTGGVMSVAFSPDGARLASGSTDKTVILWDVATGSPVCQLQGHAGSRVNWALSVAFSPDGAMLASASHDGRIILWDVQRSKYLRTLECHTMGVMSVAFSPDGAILASGSEDGTVVLWDMEALRPLA
jgi:WD40 repeat protein/tRNA A-37 threonylcarbamoyl transferase component Bud32